MPNWDAFIQIAGTLLALVLVLFLAWVLLRWMNRRVPGMGGGGARLIKVLDRVAVGRNSTLLLVRVRDKVILVGMSEHAVEKLYEFDDVDGELLPTTPEFPSFADAMKDAAKRFGKKKDGGDAP